ncbi:MAG TPA: AraC family transcriptional regulator [Thermoanaerobaculia bacterium]|jgi:AraC family transcriptional regulator
MAITLKRGEFFGRAVAAGEWNDLLLSETSYARGAFLPRHSHEEAYLTFVLGGGYRERVESETRTCTARTLVVHAHGEAHENDFIAGRARCLNIAVGSAFARRLGDAAHVLARGGVIADAAIANIGERAAAELRRADAATSLVVEGLMLELFGVLSRRNDTSKRLPAWLDEARAIVERNFQERIALVGIAAEVGVHPVSLARAFRQHFDVTVGEYVRQLRIAYARERIAAGVALPVVASEAGFADQSHFTRAFTRAVGVAPAAYRRAVKRVPER